MPNQLPGGTTPTKRGLIEAVPCPQCGKSNDFRVLAEQQLLDTGHEFDCDSCGFIMEVVAIRPVTVVTVRNTGRRADPNRPGHRLAPGQHRLPQQQPQQRGIGGFVRGLLGGPNPNKPR